VAPGKAYASKLASNGQIVIPKELRDTLHLKGGDTVVFLAEEEDSGACQITLRKRTVSYRPAVGALHHLAGRDYRKILAALDGEEPK